MQCVPRKEFMGNFFMIKPQIASLTHWNEKGSWLVSTSARWVFATAIPKPLPRGPAPWEDSPNTLISRNLLFPESNFPLHGSCGFFEWHLTDVVDLEYTRAWYRAERVRGYKQAWVRSQGMHHPWKMVQAPALATDNFIMCDIETKDKTPIPQ